MHGRTNPPALPQGHVGPGVAEDVGMMVGGHFPEGKVWRLRDLGFKQYHAGSMRYGGVNYKGRAPQALSSNIPSLNSGSGSQSSD